MRHVLAKTILAGIVDAHNHHWRNYAFADQAIAGLIHLPFHAGEGSRSLKQILTVIEIKNGIVTAGICRIVVSGRQPYSQEAGVAKNAAAKFVQSQISSRGLHADYAGNGTGRGFSVLAISSIRKSADRI